MLMVRTSDLALIIEKWRAGRPVNLLERRLVGLGCNPAAAARKIYVIRYGKSNYTTFWWADAICAAIGHPEYLQTGELEIYDVNMTTKKEVKV